MNKKNLSVVMAGAMLATSVAPVLADSTTVNNSNRGLLIKEFRELINSKTFADTTGNANVTKDEEGNTVAARNYANESVYYVKNDRAIEVSSKTITRGDYNDYTSFINAVNEERERINKKYGFSHAEINGSSTTFTHTNDTFVYEGEKGTGTGTAFSWTFKVRINANSILDTDLAIEEAIQNAEKGTKFTAWDRGHVEKDGKYYAYALEDIVTPATFSAGELELLANTWANNGKVDFDADKDGVITSTNGEGLKGSNAKNIKDAFPAVADMKYNETEKTLTVSIRKAENDSANFTKVYKAGDVKVDFTKPINEKGEVLTGTLPTSDFSEINEKEPFATYKLTANNVSDIDTVTKPGNTAKVVPAGSDLPEKEVKSVEITDVDYDYVTTLPEVYDGLFLTEDGKELLSMMKKYDSEGWAIKDVNGNNVDQIDTPFKVNEDMNGVYSIAIRFEKPIAGTAEKVEVNTVKITSKNKAQLEVFSKGIAVKEKTYGNSAHASRNIRQFPVEVLDGANRYETAVKVAKENASIRTVAENGNIVLVNGDSLVDGLAAAPLAASVVNEAQTKDYVAPILLTGSNSIPKETKEYMKEVIAHQRVGALDKVTIYLVGGTSVISKSVENELEEIGFRVVRAGGADREETSLKVAELMAKDTDAKGLDKAFVVGADGEADAMSIAPVAAELQTPIIVESVHGIKEDTVDYLKGYKNNDNNNHTSDKLESKAVTIVGGEGVVSKATEEILKDAKLTVQRVEGANRKATNAEVIRKYYANGSVDEVVVAKDGMKREIDLIDALTATSLAASDHAPIVLATDKLTDGEAGQINAIELKAKESGVYVYQAGIGVARDVVKTIAERIGLAK